MSTEAQKPASETQQDTEAREKRASRSFGSSAPVAPPRSSGVDVRLQVLHDLVRSGQYCVPAAAIADRMIEQLLAEKGEAKR